MIAMSKIKGSELTIILLIVEENEWYGGHSSCNNCSIHKKQKRQMVLSHLFQILYNLAIDYDNQSIQGTRYFFSVPHKFYQSIIKESHRKHL